MNTLRRKTWPIDLVMEIRLLDHSSAMHSHFNPPIFLQVIGRDLKDFSPQLSVLIGFLMNPNNTWGKFVCVQFLSN